MDIKSLLLKQAKFNPQKPAVIFQERIITFLEIKDAAFKLADYFISLGVNKSDKAALFLSNTPEAIYSFLGVFSAGASIIPLDFMLTEEEIVQFINHSEAKLLIIQQKKGIEVENIKNKCPCLKEVIVCAQRADNFLFLEDILKSSSYLEPEVNVQETDLSSIFYTSGSTGHPKGVMLTYEHLCNPVKSIDYFLKVNCEDVFLCAGVPFSHIGGLDYILLMLEFSSTLILMERFHPLEFLKNIERYKVTIFCIVPAMYVAILSLKEYDKFNLSSLRYAVVFGAPSSPILLERFHKAYPNACLSNGWGMTETAAPNCMLPPGSAKIESIGRFTPGMQAKIVDSEGVDLGVNQHGELWVKGKAVMKGYYKEEKLTREVLTKDGWLKTGDIAYCDEQGLFYIAGRKKDMIKVAGEIVFSAEVEEKIQRHNKIHEAAVVGIPDKLRGEVPKAYIVLKDGETLDAEELREFLKNHLAHFKMPHYFEFVKGLPKNRTGKIDKQALR